MWKPDVSQFSTPIKIRHRVSPDTLVNGAPKASYADADPAIDFCKWKGRGGTESVQAGSLTVMDTAELTMWYRPDVSERDLVLLNADVSKAYEIINVENVEMCNQFMILKVRRTVNA